MDLFVIAILILLGALLLTLEVVFIPGFGLTGIMGALALLGAVAYSFIFINALAGWIALAIVVLVLVVLILWAIYGKTIDKMSLQKNIDSTVKNPETETVKIGDTGVAITRLALVGEVDFNGHIVEAVSSDGFIEEKTAVTVVRMSGGSIFVAKEN